MVRRKPRHPGRNAGRAELQSYMSELEQWQLEYDNEKAEREQRERNFPADNGTISGQSAYIEQKGNRTVGYQGKDKVEKIATNDGLNASFVRDETGEVYVDDTQPDPYKPYRHSKYC